MSSYNLLKTLQFPASVLKPYTTDDETQQSDHLPLGGFFHDSKYAWLARGAVLQIVSTTSQTRISEWVFGSILKDHTIKITTVAEIKRQGAGLPLLAVGLQSNIVGGLVCIYDVALSKVIRTIDVKHNVSSVIFVETENGSMPLPGPLRAFDGVLAVGLNKGDVLLIDLCWQVLDEVVSGNGDATDELNPSGILILPNKSIPKIEHYKQKSIKKGFHLAIHLNCVDKDPSEHFKLIAHTGETMVLVNRVEVTVSALHYCPQLGSLLVGYNFGALQLWNIINMELVYTSPVYEKNMPVSHFAVQEPSDDPKAFCYVWAVYSSTEPFIDDFPVAALYSFNYTSKEYHEGYGHLYEGFVSCRVRFQMDLTLPDDFVPVRKPKGAWCVGLEALNKNRNTTLLELPEDDLVISCFVWTVWCSRTETYTYQAIFDLNQWYKEQMPGEPQWDDCGSYLMYKQISELYLNENKENASVLATVLKLSSISQFMGVQRLEEHYYPSSLSFHFSLLRDKDCLLVAVKGIQKALLQHLQLTGPLALIQPSKLYQEAIRLGLSPLFTDAPSDISVSENDQRKFMLSVAMEQQMLSWLCSCAREWANGSLSFAGCTLDFLINWAWERAVALKNNADNLCVSLFDYSGLKLDINSQKIVSCCCRQLANLHVFYTFILDKMRAFLYDHDLIQLQCNKLHMVSTYFEVLQWLINVKLLPETADVEHFDSHNDCVPYPLEIITNYYNKRRGDLLNLCEKRFREKCNLLFIDNLIETYCGGNELQTQWEEVEGNGSYPPPSLQALLRTYLVESAKMSHKHSLVIYVFLDLAMVLNQDRYTETITQLIKFPAVFKLSQSLIKITQAFWQLDHEDFSTAVEHLLDPLVLDSDLKLWHHRIILRALLVQEQYNFGLLYLKTRNPPLVNDDDFKLAISFYIANAMVDNGFSLLRQNGTNNPNDKLLIHLFSECVRFDKTREVLNYPLTLEEENAFFTYLETINHPHTEDIRVFYNINRSRFMDAYELNNRALLKRYSTKGSFWEEHANFRDTFITAYKDLMPEVSHKLLSVCQKEKAAGLWIEVPKPVPMSVFIHDTKEQVKYKSTIVNAGLSKAMDTWTYPILRDKLDDFIKTEETPFLRTPKVDLKEKRKMTPSIIEPSIVPDDGPSPPKRAKLESISESFMKRFDTPIVKRKSSRLSSRASLDGTNVCTPHSILKVGNLVRKLDEIATPRGESTTPEDLNEVLETTAKTESGDVEVPHPKKRFSFGLTPRRSISRLDNHSVRFTGLSTPSTNTTTSASLRNSNSLREEASKSTSFGDSFQSVDSSILLSESHDSKLEEIVKQLKEIDEDTDETENSETKETTPIKCPETPKRRRSLRSTPVAVRQSPRLAQRAPSDGNISIPSSPQESSTPASSPRRALPTKRMSLQQKVLTHNALKALTPKARTIETSYSKVDTVTTKITTGERTEESVVTSVVKRTDVVKEEATAQSHEHKETSKTTSEKSISEYSENDVVFDNYSPYKGLNLSDSIFQSDTEETKSAAEEVQEQDNMEVEPNQEVEDEIEYDPTFNIYESPDELAAEGENSQETHTVLTEMPILSDEQYSAMEEENIYDELHEECFDEEVIVQEYLSSPSKPHVERGETEPLPEPVLSAIIELDSSSASEKGNAEGSERSSINSSSNSEEKSSESDDASVNSDDKDLEEAAKEEDDAVQSDASASSKEDESSNTSDSDNCRESIFDEDTVETPTKATSEDQNNVVSQETMSEEYAHLPQVVIEEEEEEIVEIVTEEAITTSNVEAIEQAVDNSSPSVVETVDVDEYSEENQQGIEREKQEVEEPMQDAEAIEYTTTVLRPEESVESKKQEVKEVMVNVEIQPEEDQESKKNTEQEVVMESKLPPVAEVEDKTQHETEDNRAEKEEREDSLRKQETSNNQQKSDLDFSVLSESHMSRSLGLTLHKTDLSFSFKSSKSDLDFSVSSDEGSLRGFTTTSTPHIKKTASNEGFEPQILTPRTRRSKSVDFSLVTTEPLEGRTLRKRSISVESTEKPQPKKRNVPVQLPAILEEDKEANNAKRKRQPKKTQSTTGVLEERRTTRQKSRLEKAVTAQGSSSSEEDERGPALDLIDPLQLLHKSSFKGKPDPEEAKVQRKSPSRSSRTSIKSEISEMDSVSETDVSRKRSFTKAKTISPPPLTIRTRSRTKSVDLPPKTEKKAKTRSSTRKVEDDNESVSSDISTRSRSTRAASVSSVKSDTAALHKTKQNPSRRAQKSLTKIAEESTDEAKPRRRTTRASSAKI